MDEGDDALDTLKLKRLQHRLYRMEKEQRFLVKDRSLESAVLEEVFDKHTLMTLYDLMNSKLFKYLNGVVNSGKESRIYWGVGEDGSDLAVKIYLVATSEFKRRLPYIIGDPRFKRVERGSRKLVELWARKEFKNLATAHRSGIPVPKPYAVKGNVLIMEFIGDDGRPAPLLCETAIVKKDYLTILSILKKMYREAKLVHADLSEFNIFKWKKHLILFDFGSAVDIAHPNSQQFLIRDILNINRFFEKRGFETRSLDDILKKVVG